MLRNVLLAASNSQRCKDFVEHSPLTRPAVERFVAGNDEDAAIAVVRALARDRLVSVDRLGEATESAEDAAATAQAYGALLARLAAEGLSGRAEISLKLSALGLGLPVRDGGHAITLENARAVCAAARDAGTTVTVDMEHYPLVEPTLRIVTELRRDHPDVGAVVQAYLFRTPDDCRALAGAGSRVRLCKGAYDEPPSVAHQTRAETDESYRACLRVLMAGEGYPMVATHDPALIEYADQLAVTSGRTPADFEHQMLYGIRADEQRRIAAAGLRMRVYVPFGSHWYPYLMRRLGERPANLRFFLRSFAPGA